MKHIHDKVSLSGPKIANSEQKPSRYDRFVAWYQKNGKVVRSSSTASKFIKFLISFGIAYGVNVLVYFVWFDHAVFFANPNWDFWAKTAVIFIAAAGLLVVLNSAMKSEGNTTALALLLFLFVNGAQHYVKSYYDANGNSKVFIDSSRGYIYLEKEAAQYTEIKTTKTGKRYFIHPVSGDTCWNESPRNIDVVKESNYNPPTKEVDYSASESSYTFTLKAGQILDHWIVLKTKNGKNVHFEILSDDYNYYMVFSETERYYGGPDVVVPNKDLARFFLQAGSTDQVITMKLSYY